MKKMILLSILTMGFISETAITKERISSYPFIAGDTFRAIADHIVDETVIPFNPYTVKHRDIIFLKTDYVPYFFEKFHPKIGAQYILITHNSDVSPIYLKALDHPWLGYDFSHYLNDPKLVVWFAQNIDYVHPKLKPLPIGVSNNYNSNGKVGFFINATRNVPGFVGRHNYLYLNFTPSTNTKERQSAIDFFRNKPYAYITHGKTQDAYLEELKHFKYVLCPEGNGIDCHRTWEALLMGCIPILKHSRIDTLFEDLPVILINDWSEITKDFLEERAKEMANKKYKVEKIYADYWIHLIRSYK